MFPLGLALVIIAYWFFRSPLAQATAEAIRHANGVPPKSAVSEETLAQMTEELTLLGVRYTPSAGNFLLVDTGRDCEEDFVRLLHEGVIVRPMKIYGFPTSLRVTIGTHPENEQFLEALRRVMTSPVRAL